MKIVDELKEVLESLVKEKYIFSYGIFLRNHNGDIFFEKGIREGEKYVFNIKEGIVEIFLNISKERDKRLLELFITKYFSLLNKIGKLEERVRELNILQEVGNKINSTLRLKDLLNLIMLLSKETLEAEASSLMLLDEKSKELVFEVALGEKGDIIKQFRVPLGDGIAGWVAITGEPIIVNDVSKDPRFARKYDSATSFKTKSILCVPLKTKEKIIGVIEVLNKIGIDKFDENDLNLLQAIANQAAIAIENARLYQDLKELFFDTVESLASAIDAKDPYTHGHSRRVAQYAEMIAKEMGYSSDFVEKVRLSALLHDIGKIGIDEFILRKN